MQPKVNRSGYSLGEVSIFEDLPSEALQRIEKLCSWRRYREGESIIDYLEDSKEVFFLISGKALVTIYSQAGKAVRFSDLVSGEVFGEYPAIAGGTRSASVEARSECMVASMSSTAFLGTLRTEPDVAQALLVKLVRKVRDLTDRVYEFSTLAVSNRVQAEILRLARSASPIGNTARINPSPTHAEIASRLSTHREAVTRELNRLTKVGLIERSKGSLLIKNIEGLERMVNQATGE